MKVIFSVFASGWKIISSEGKRTLVIYSLSLISLSALDAAGLYILATSGIQSLTDDKSQIDGKWLLIMIALFTARSIMASIVSRWGLSRFARQEVLIGEIGFENLENSPWERVNQLSLSHSQNVIDRGPTALIQGVMMPIVTIVSEAVTALVIGISIFSLQPATALIVSTYFAITFAIQHALLSRSAHNTGEKIVGAQDGVYRLISDHHNLSKVLRVQPSQSLKKELRKKRELLANNRAHAFFLGSLPRYFLEATLALGFLVVSGVTYILNGYEDALAATSLFAVAGFRLLPIVNRIQGQLLFTLSQIPLASLTIYKEETKEPTTYPKLMENFNAHSLPTPNESSPLLTIRNASYTYPGSNSPVLNNISLNILPRKSYAIVGPSGSGKTTLADLILGLIEPSTGTRLVSEELNSSDISYVPQDVQILSGSLQENIALEWDENFIDLPQVTQSAKEAELTFLFDQLEGSKVGDGFQSISGGQRQRIGFARALYRNPTLLVLDEATSSLDGNTEYDLMKQIEKIRDRVTTITIAHRLSTIQNADKIFYLSGGAILGEGTFSELVNTIPDFAVQVSRSQLDTFQIRDADIE